MNKHQEHALLTATADFVVGKSLITLHKTVDISPVLLIDNNTYQKPYVIKIINPETYLYIGNQDVTIQSGFPVSSENPTVVLMLENTRLYGIALTTLDVYILDMGL